MKRANWMLPFLLVIATSCAVEQPTTDTATEALVLTGGTPAACALPTPGVARLSKLAFDGRTISKTSLVPADRYNVDLVLAHGGVYGDGDWSCEVHDHGSAGHSVICSNTVTGVTCGFHNWSDGPEVGCDDPDHPTC